MTTKFDLISSIMKAKRAASELNDVPFAFASVHPDFKENFFKRLCKEFGFIEVKDTGSEFCGMRIYTAEEVPFGDVWFGYMPNDVELSK